MNQDNPNIQPRNGNSAPNRRGEEAKYAPSAMTLGILRQFARVYRVEKRLKPHPIAIYPN